MKALSLLSLSLALAAPAVCSADEPYRIRPVDIRGTLSVVEGRLMVGLSGKLNHGSSEWTLPPGWRTKPVSLSPSGAGAYRGWSIGYDPKTRQGVVTLDKPGEVRCFWKISDAKGPVGSYLRADAGKYEGWYLTVDDKVEKATDRDGKPYTFHRLLLTKEPSKRSLWTISEIGR